MDLLDYHSQLPKIPCPNHKDKYLELINVNPECKQKLCCYECVFEYSYPNQQILQMKEIFNSSHDFFLNKWLQFEQPINKEIFTTIFITNYEKTISTFFQETLLGFKKSINDYIDNLLQKMENGLMKLDNQNQKLKKSFLEHQFQSQLKQCISQKSQDRTQLEEEISELISGLQKENRKFEQEVQDYAQSYQYEINSQQDILLSFPKQLYSYMQQNTEQFRCSIPQKIQENFNDLQVILGLQNLNLDMIKKSNQACYGELQVNINNYQELEIFNEKDQNCQCYVDLNLYKNEKYEILLDCWRDQSEQTIYIGLCPLSIIHTVYLYNYNSHIPVVYNTSQMNLKIDKGIQINNDDQLYQQIKIQICINEKVFRWKFGENINSTKDWISFKQNEPHFLAFQMYYANSKVLIKQIKRVYQFEEW